jgi:hypothetical protein
VTSRTAEAIQVEFSDSNRTKVEDKKIDGNLTDAELSNRLFVRLVAKQKEFTKIDFKYCIFDTCYLRQCVFDRCDFTGCRFVGTSFYGSRFSGCKFDYSIFERTIVATDLLSNCCPAPENLKMKFARTLRVNYQQLGDAQAANMAIHVELEATREHLWKAWRSNDWYYRHKYPKGKRIKAFLNWLGFKFLDWIWGNGESAWKLFRAVIILLVLIALRDVFAHRDPWQVGSYLAAAMQAPQIFLGTLSPSYYSPGYFSVIVFCRLVAFAFLMSIIIKRLNRR